MDNRVLDVQPRDVFYLTASGPIGKTGVSVDLGNGEYGIVVRTGSRVPVAYYAPGKYAITCDADGESLKPIQVNVIAPPPDLDKKPKKASPSLNAMTTMAATSSPIGGNVGSVYAGVYPDTNSKFPIRICVSSAGDFTLTKYGGGWSQTWHFDAPGETTDVVDGPKPGENPWTLIKSGGGTHVLSPNSPSKLKINKIRMHSGPASVAQLRADLTSSNLYLTPSTPIVLVVDPGPGWASNNTSRTDQLYEWKTNNAALPVPCFAVSNLFSFADPGTYVVSVECKSPSTTPIKQSLTINILKVDLEIYKPKVIDPAEAMIPDASEMTTGSVTFVNLDNDDNDSKFDYNPDGAGTHDDDELVKVKLKIRPNNLTQGQVKLLATAGAGNIAVWTNNNKAAASAYTLGTPLNVPGDLTVEGDSLVKTLWVEGISAHTVQKGTTLKMEYTVTGTTCDDEAALTVVGVDQITWQGKTNSVSDTSVLDADPNWPAGLTPNAVRVFPDARVVGGAVESNPRDKVVAEVMLTVEPPIEIKMYLDSFDVDDPTASTNVVDNETAEEDNRGASPAKSGQFTGEAGGVKELVFPAGVKTTNCEFQVTMQPGDNFRVVANGDKDFLSRLENKDSAAGATDADKQRICNKDVTGTLPEREVRLAADYASDTLVVWRFLHVEVDSMAAPTTTGAEKNTADGNLTGIVGNGTVAQRVNLNINLKTGFTPQDNSANLTAGTGNGRFENGWIKIGSGGGTPGQTQTSTLLGNGDDYVRKDAGIDIPAVVSKAGEPNVIGKVIAWSGSAFNLSVSSGTLSTNYNGGTLNVAGASATVSTVNTNGGTNIVNVTAAPTIPFVLHDDDADGLPHLPDTDLMETKYAPAYLRSLIDGGTDASLNKDSISFRRNIDSASHAAIDAELSKSAAFESEPSRTSRYWIVYVLTTFQANPIGDYDPDTSSNNEWGPHGVNGGGASYRRGSLYFHESNRDYGSQYGLTSTQVTTLERRHVVHETGHQFGITHSDPTHNVGLYNYSDAYNLGIDPRFEPVHLNLIRNKVTSPGQ